MDEPLDSADTAAILQLVEEVELGAELQLNISAQNAIVVHNITACSDFGVPLDLEEVVRCLGNSIYEPQEFYCARVDVRIKTSLSVDNNITESKGFAGIEHVVVKNADRVPMLQSTLSRRFPNIDPLHLQQCAKLGKCYYSLESEWLTAEYSTLKASIFSNGKVSLTGGKSMLAIAVGLWKLCRAIRQRINKAASVRSFVATNILAVYHYPSQLVLQAFEKQCKGSVYDPFRFAGVRLRLPVKSSICAYDIRQLVFAAFGKSSRNDHQAFQELSDGTSSSDDSDSFDNMSDEQTAMPSFGQQQAQPMTNNKQVLPRPVQNAATAVTQRSRIKGNLRRFITNAISSNKRTVHQGSSVVPEPAAKKPQPVDTNAGNRVWCNNKNAGVLDTDVTKEEVVTINVYTTGNVMFTGARSKLMANGHEEVKSSVLNATTEGIPQCATNAGPVDAAAEWEERLNEEFAALIHYVEENKANDTEWFTIDCDDKGTKWFGECWHVHNMKTYRFRLEINIPAAYPNAPPDIVLPDLDGKTAKMYRGGSICLDAHFAPLWQKNVPRYGIAHGLALGVGTCVPLSNDVAAGTLVSE
ncbi:Ufm1-conjugating enzyme 1, putative [Babesia ovis]|uniref:Ubiquitin-fold modifier-conjugating enzyme 1 n=1 Tax=Babesia ovis TaxID=5869 RepID=A0A9W5TDM4_BABOV|nr:Ufm1-conjugating enzyme 1, putative [Babesia ovis]